MGRPANLKGTRKTLVGDYGGVSAPVNGSLDLPSPRQLYRDGDDAGRPDALKFAVLQK